MAEMIIRLEVDPHTQKKNVIIRYRSDGDALPMEHEDEHRNLVDQLIEGGTLEAAEVGAIIVEREESGSPLLSADVLEQLIRFYGGAMQELFGDYLERSVSAFTEQQDTFQAQVRQMLEDNPMADMAKRNLELWDQLHQMVGKAWSGAAHNKKSGEEDD